MENTIKILLEHYLRPVAGADEAINAGLYSSYARADEGEWADAIEALDYY